MVAVTVKEKTPTEVVVPLRTPDTLFRVNPTGSAPPVTLQPNGVVPVALNGKLYGTPADPSIIGLVVVMVGTTNELVTTMVKFVGPAIPTELVADNAKVVLAATSGVPLKRQEELRVAQDGSPVAEQVGVGVPLTTNWKVNGDPVLPPGNC